ncbi:hypothetical protein ElyMa_005641200 [Elysia marginata]|uniref:Uncharacterized protein n=1 Tax=Elysia marginata TaxID=1093978 RepID=A0AAV4F9Q5_9GAST|nr:hypothetical protein ElyMa_005641200 [Elysia marginata]
MLSVTDLVQHLLEQTMTEDLDQHLKEVTIVGRITTNIRFSDDIDSLAGGESELASEVNRLDKASTIYGMGISAEKVTLRTNRDEPVQTAKPWTIIRSIRSATCVSNDQLILSQESYRSPVTGWFEHHVQGRSLVMEAGGIHGLFIT